MRKATLVTVCYLSLLVGCKNEPSTVLGTLERERVLLTAVENEVVEAIYVKQGQLVNQGQLLLQLRNKTAKAHLAQAKANLQKAQAALAKLRNGTRPERIQAKRGQYQKATAELRLAQISFTRAEQLKDKDVQSKADYDRAKANFDIAKANQQTLKAELAQLIKGARIETINEAKGQVLIAKANLQTRQEALAKLTIKATRNGIVEALPWHQGERVSLGAPVAVLLSGAKPFARAYIPQKKRAKLHIGDNLTIKVDGYNTSFQGKVRSLANHPSFTPYYALTQSDRDRLVYLAEIDLTEDKAKSLPSGLPVSVML